MGRPERRRIDRAEAWVNNLPEDKRQLIYSIINEKSDAYNNAMGVITNLCIVNALDDILCIGVPRTKEVMDKMQEYIADYAKYLETEKDGGIDMIENQELRNNVKEKIKAYRKDNLDKARSLKLLKNEFNLPFAELSDLWIESKVANAEYGKCELWDGTKSQPGIDPRMDPKIQSKGNKPKSKKSKDTNNIDESKKNSKLTIIKVTTEVQGDYGVYIKSKNGVQIDDKCYNDINEVKKEKEIVCSEYNTKKENIKDKIKSLNAELENVEHLGLNELNKLNELESVFSI